jgi:hypothetical protein
MITSHSTRSGATASTALPQRKAPVATEAARLPFRVLQSSRSPAQLSLYLRPGLTSR